METITTSVDQTQTIAEDFAKTVHAGDSILLYGNLGAGKTTFVQGFVKGLGIKKRIISPTFIIVRSYALKVKSQKLKVKNTIQNSKMDQRFYHVDLYRLRGEKDLQSTGLTEILQDAKSIIAIEWPEKMGNKIPQKRWEVRIEYIEENQRKITINHVL